jgi:hypothetical protein
MLETPEQRLAVAQLHGGQPGFSTVVLQALFPGSMDGFVQLIV